MWIMRGDSLSVVARTLGIAVRSARSPWRTAMPRSSRKARIWLITAWGVLNGGRNFEVRSMRTAPQAG